MPLSNGITAHPTKLSIKVIMGASKNTILSDPDGIIISFVNNLIPSANGWSSPNGPTTLGPLLSCIEAITFLSKYVSNATNINRGNIIKSIFIKDKLINLIIKW